jgi:hypothetical protein
MHEDLSNPINGGAGKNGYTSYLQTNNDNFESIGGGGGGGMWTTGKPDDTGSTYNLPTHAFAKIGASGGGGHMNGDEYRGAYFYGANGLFGGSGNRGSYSSAREWNHGGGGGGAGALERPYDQNDQINANGRAGLSNNYTGVSNKFYGGGGGGGTGNESKLVIGLGIHGGGNGAYLNKNPYVNNYGGTSGQANTGGGGGGAGVFTQYQIDSNGGTRTHRVYLPASGKNGGSGIIILKYTI